MMEPRRNAKARPSTCRGFLGASPRGRHCPAIPCSIVTVPIRAQFAAVQRRDVLGNLAQVLHQDVPAILAQRAIIVGGEVVQRQVRLGVYPDAQIVITGRAHGHAARWSGASGAGPNLMVRR